ncbi:MAG: 50S ribosomal protein L10 [Deltaproteobacteria bacterium]|nr:50S ribosomal protein L10 [Deltaproteobacteria bacterium]
MNRTQKAAIIEGIKAKAGASSIVVVSDFKGMPVEEMTRLRIKIRESGGELVVVKNTLARIALTDSAHDAIKDSFKENCAVAFGMHDPVALAKAVSSFAKTSKTLDMKLGSLEGKPLTADQVEALAKLPSKPELLAKALGTMNAVPTNFVSLLANTIRPLLYALKAIEEKKAA